MKIGIDFGTSFSLPATIYLNSDITLLPGGKYGIPSVFYFDEWEGVLIGEEAEAAGQGNESRNLKREIKLELNSTFTADGHTFSARQIVGYILSNVKETALSVARTKLINEPLEGVVISVPVAFGHNEKEYIREAAEIPVSAGGPGFNVLGFIKEPVAAALAYFKTPLADQTRILVYDLGGGTCDVAIVEADSTYSEKYTVIDSDMRRIGGKDWDGKLEIYIARELEKQSGMSIFRNPAYQEKIKRAAISAKHAFSEQVGGKYRDRVRARVEVNGRSYQIPITKEMFDELTLDLLNETIKMTRQLLNRNSGSKITKLICVGGSSNMPQVTEGLRRAFPTLTLQVFEPEKAIAVGAAIYAQFCEKPEKHLSDIASYSYGIRAYKDYEARYLVIDNMIKKSERLPVSRVHEFFTIEANMAQVSFKVYESENTSDEYDYSAGEKPIMEVALDLPPNCPQGMPLEATMTLTEDGLIEVIADDRKGHKIKGRKQLYF